MNDKSLYETVVSTFFASVKSVGTACTLAGVGVYLHQKGFIVGNGKRTLALISQQVTIPLLFFTKILYCNQDWSLDPCPNVTNSLKDVWILLIWPLWVCTAGLLVGYGVTKIANVPYHQRNSILASVAFGNSTGLPITLLTVIHSNFGVTSALGVIDPTLFLSVYLVMYPVLQWGIGGFLLAPPMEKNVTKVGKTNANNIDNHHDSSKENSVADTEEYEISSCEGPEEEILHIGTGSLLKSKLAHNVLNQPMTQRYHINHRGLDSVDASMYMSVQENLNRWGNPVSGRKGSGDFGSSIIYYDSTKDTATSTNVGNSKNWSRPIRTESNASIGMDLSGRDQIINEDENGNNSAVSPLVTTESTSLLPKIRSNRQEYEAYVPRITSRPSFMSSLIGVDEEKQEKLIETVQTVLKRCFQPPVIAALTGLLFASFPQVRGVFVDIADRNGSAPFQWLFDGLYAVGQAAVPINMIILGCNLSASYMLEQPKCGGGDSVDSANVSSKFFSKKASLCVVIGKMVVLPIVGVVSAFVLRKIYRDVPTEFVGGLYLVLLVVFLCPTANNVMIMVELSSGGGSDNNRNSSGCASPKEGMARIIAYQYAVAPIVLSGTVTCAVLIASHMTTPLY